MSYSTWHPAFMPDTAEVPLMPKCSSPPPPKPSLLQLELEHADNLSQDGVFNISSDNLKQGALNKRVIKGISEDTELFELPISQGTVEHSSTIDNKIRNDKEVKVGISQNCKDGRLVQHIASQASQNKHKSTMSFTRTISEEVTWTDEEIDLDRTETISLNSTAKSNQINSFSQLPSQSFPEEAFNCSQDDKCIDEVDQSARDLFTDQENIYPSDFFAKTSTVATQRNSDGQEIPSAYDFGNDEQPSYSKFQEINHFNKELLNENGSPTFPELNPHGEASSTSKEIKEIQNSDLSTHDYEVFHEQWPARDSEGIITSEREEVLSQGPEKQALDIFHNPVTKIPQSFHESSANESDFSFNTSMSPQTCINSDIVLHSISENLENQNMNSGDEDLAAKWREALGSDVAGDGLLEDNDFLPDVTDPIDGTVDEKEIDPALLFGSDDEGFLDDSDETSSDLFDQHKNISSLSPNDKSQPIGLKNGSNQLEFIDPKISHSMPGYNMMSATPNEYFKHPQSSTLPSTIPPGPTIVSPQIKPQRPDFQKAKSFATMSKGGYSSPYDLPMDVVPKKRRSIQSMNRVTSQPNTPPRHSSMLNQPRMNSITPMTMSRNFTQPIQIHHTQSENLSRKPQGSFFEDLPMSSKSKTSSKFSSSSLLQNKYHEVPPLAGAVASESGVSFPQIPLQQQNQNLIAPQRANPYVPQLATDITNPSHLISNQTSQSQTVSLPSYSPNSNNTTKNYISHHSASSPVATNLRSHYPRTSSPLAHYEKSQNVHMSGTHYRTANTDHQKRSNGHETTIRSLSTTREVDENDLSLSLQDQTPHQPVSLNTASTFVQGNPSPSKTSNPRAISSPPKHHSKTYVYQHQNDAPLPFVPPQRSRTQSPKSAYFGSRNENLINTQNQRPASVEPSLPILSQLVTNFSPQRVPGDSSQKMNYIIPSDGRENDPLQRWKGSPVFAWGVGGSIVTSFPQNLSRYNINQSSSMTLRYPGEVKIQNIKEICPLNLLEAQFPGPLRGKSKKKDVIGWLSSGIELLESNATHLKSTSNLTHKDKRLEERILLWRILRIFIEHDGILEGTASVEEAVRAILSPEEKKENSPLYTSGTEIRDVPDSTITIQAEAVDPAAVDKLKNYLFQGQQEKAVWEAVDKRLWAHAIIISNSVSQNLYKQVAQEFIQKELRSLGEKTQSLAVLYEIFAGNFEESIDELVPPSARAGFQMVSTSNNIGPSKDASNGLDKWRETLSLILSNRNAEDNRALIALGKLLASYGRAEAAHICFLFARSQAVFSGIDDPLATFVLLGSDQLKQPHEFDREMESILISEVFEYGMSLSSQSFTVSSSHLAVYKLHYAKVLAEYGFRDKALKYCETIASLVTSQTRRSPYHHAHLISEVDDLCHRLKQSPKDETGSWISKPSIDKARGSVWATFNKFVAGEDSSDAETALASGIAPEAGPFSKIAGETPTISRPPSTDFSCIYNSNLGINSTSKLAVKSSNSRYIPNSTSTIGAQEPTINFNGSQTRLTGNNSLNDYKRQEPQRYTPSTTEVYNPRPQINPDAINKTQTNLNHPSQLFYNPYGMVSSVDETAHESFYPPITEQSLPGLPAQSSNNSGNYRDSISSTSHQFSQTHSIANDAQIKSPESGLSDSSCEPLKAISGNSPVKINDSYHVQKDNISRQNSVIDDEVGCRVTEETPLVANEKTRAEKDRETEEAFRRAAEADAKRDKEAAPVKRGWSLTSWFGGGAKKDQDATSSPNKPIRAKLGEESSFVYDPELKRWVNKKASAEQAESKTSLPPPPRTVGPPRSASVLSASTKPAMSTSVPPIAALSKDNQTYSDIQQSSKDVSATVTDAPFQHAAHVMARTASSGSIKPPSRPGTSMSNASSIDDLLGPPSVGRRPGVKAKKKGRGYVDVMSDAAP